MVRIAVTGPGVSFLVKGLFLSFAVSLCAARADIVLGHLFNRSKRKIGCNGGNLTGPYPWIKTAKALCNQRFRQLRVARQGHGSDNRLRVRPDVNGRPLQGACGNCRVIYVATIGRDIHPLFHRVVGDDDMVRHPTTALAWGII
ncbi:hypothetical protein DWB67_12765 [Paracoccus sp. JM45]|nr:hypothetical protein DWB67_12765 [Paracoccus sp. JM45]